jgi:hypothetical protein
MSKMTFDTPEKATMAPCYGEKRDRLSDHTDQPAASRNPKDLKFLGAGDNAPKISSNGKDPIDIEDSPPRSDKMPMVWDDMELALDDKEKAYSVVKLISSGGLDKDIIVIDDDDAKTSVSLLKQDEESTNKDNDDNSNDTHKLADAIMQVHNDDNTDMYNDNDNKLTITSGNDNNNKTTQWWNVADMEADTPLFAPCIGHPICLFLL